MQRFLPAGVRLISIRGSSHSERAQHIRLSIQGAAMAYNPLRKLSLCMLAACCVFACEVGWTVHGNRCLKVLGSVATFHAAQQACLAETGSPLLSRIVHFDSDADISVIVSALSLSTIQSYWVDGHFALRGMGC